jgi:hypothetical protein
MGNLMGNLMATLKDPNVLKPGMFSPLGQISAEAKMHDVFIHPDPQPPFLFRLTQSLLAQYYFPTCPKFETGQYIPLGRQGTIHEIPVLLST